MPPALAVVLGAGIVLALAAVYTSSHLTVVSSTRSTPSPSAVSSSAPSTQSAVPVVAPTLCQAIPSLDQLVLQSVQPAAHHRVHTSASAVITGTGKVRAIASELCSLPPATSVSCAAQPGIWVQFLFSHGDIGYWTAWANTGGCEDVIGIGGQTRTAARSQLWRTVRAALGAGSPLG